MPKRVVYFSRSKVLPRDTPDVEYRYHEAADPEALRPLRTSLQHQPSRIESAGMRQANVLSGREVYGARVPKQPTYTVDKRWDARSGRFVGKPTEKLSPRVDAIEVRCMGRVLYL